MQNRKALVIFSGGQDSTTCLLQAIADYGRENVETISFQYGQRHAIELEKAKWIAEDLGVKQTVIDTSVIKQTTNNALIDDSQEITATKETDYPNTFVDGRNMLFLLLAGCYAKQQDICDIIIGVCETGFSGYNFNLITPLMYLTKAQTWEMADKLGYLDYVRKYTHTCYYGVDGGCGKCPSCILRDKGLTDYLSHSN